MQQLNKISIFEAAEFVRGTRIRQYVTFAARQTHRLTRLPYLVAEVIPSLKCNGRTKYQFWRLLHSCAASAHLGMLQHGNLTFFVIVLC